jgi:hypothetical protein
MDNKNKDEDALQEVTYTNDVDDSYTDKTQENKYINKSNIIVVFKVSGVYILWILLHYFASHLYIFYCVPNTYIGFFMSPFMTMTPHCQGLRWIIHNGANIIDNMWIILGTWLCTNIFIIGRTK